MKIFAHPERIQAGQLVWLELEEYPVKLAVRVFRVVPGNRAEVEPFAADGDLITVDKARLWEEKP